MPNVFSKHSLQYKQAVQNLEHAAFYFSKNRTEQISFNKYGNKDGQGLVPVSDYFIDTFVMRYTFKENDTEELNKLHLMKLQSLIKKQFNNTYHVHVVIQPLKFIEVRLNLPDIGVDTILNFIQSDEVKSTDFVLWAIDVTRDFSGSFELYEVIEYFKMYHNLQTGLQSDGIYMEKDMESGTGTNCFIFKNKSKATRSKIYLKFPQILQTDKVRAITGQRWTSWIETDKNSSFVNSRDNSSERGLTRLEVTYYTEGLVTPDKSFLFQQIDELVSMLPPSIFYSTSHASMWSAYAENLKHSLVIADESFGKTSTDAGGLALVVYSIDNSCGKVAGMIIKNWNKHNGRLLSRLTFSSLLPIDYIKLRVGDIDEDGIVLHCEKYIFQKKMKLGFPDVTLLYGNKGIIIRPEMTQQDISSFGFVNNINCMLMAANKQVYIGSKKPCTLHLQDTEPSIALKRCHTSKTRMDSCTAVSDKSSSSSIELSPTATDLQNFDIPSLEEVKTLPLVRLNTLKRGAYIILAVILSKKEYPKLIFIEAGIRKVVYCSKLIKDSIPANIKLDCNGMFTSEKCAGQLIVNFHRKNPNSSKVNIVLNL